MPDAFAEPSTQGSDASKRDLPDRRTAPFGGATTKECVRKASAPCAFYTRRSAAKPSIAMRNEVERSEPSKGVCAVRILH